MAKKILTLILCVLTLTTLIGSLEASAAAYKSYTYNINGEPVDSPDAFTPDRQVDSIAMGLAKSSYPNLVDPADMVVDDDGNVYIVDRGNVDVPGRIIVLDSNYKFKMELGLSFYNDQGVPDSLNAPSGMFVTEDLIYVADTENKRIVVFKTDGTFDHIVLEPSSRLMGSDAIYKPVALAVDASGNLYVVSSTTYMGIIVMDKTGKFQCFLGAQKAEVDLTAILWRSFQTAEQIAQSEQYLPTEYNNITIDKEGFVYVTSSSIEETAQQNSIMSKSGDYASVKKLNASGEDVMMRSGFFGPGGEVNISWIAQDENSIVGASRIIDVALGPDGTWTILDEKRSKFYTYDTYGRLLHVFGDKGEMLGNLKSGEAIVYQGTKLLCLDKQALNITVYERTEYGDIIANALRNSLDRRYDLAVDDWNAILQRNGNFDIAYVGIGKAYYRAGDWNKAMEYFKYAYDTDNYSLAFKEYRKEVLADNTLFIPNSIITVVVVLAFIIGLVKLFSWAGKVNKAATAKGGKRSFKEEVLYAFYLFSHPFDGFWDLKHEKRGSMRGAMFWLFLAVASFTYQEVGRAYLFNPTGAISNVFVQAISILLPVFLVVTSNWCLTTLFDGEGSYKDILIASCYSLAPLPLFVIPATLLTHVFSLNEAGIVSLLTTLAWIWVGILVFFGLMITHGYSLFKNFVTVIATIVGIAVIMFIGLLFTGLIQKIVGFISSIVTELSFR
ncbi:MAG: YIP1 family protein [Clostridia bacterium]|nr:YIP1 family protein [Clostridia bacterium]